LNKKWLIVAMVMCIIGISLTILCSLFSSTPSGVYFDLQVGAVGGGYWRFKSGEVHLQTGSTSEFIDVYSQSNGMWVSDHGKKLLKPSLFGIEVVDTVDSSLNRYLPRRGFVWAYRFQKALGLGQMRDTPPGTK
jgi:hypothetical protein